MTNSPQTSLLSPESIARLSPLGLRARTVVEGFVAGLHKSPFHGFNVEFAEHREYSPGDELRHIDWKTYARTEKYHIKLFEEETNMRVHLLMDISNSMSYQERGPVSKLHYASCLTAAMAWLALRQKDAVGMALVNDSVARYLPPSSRMSQLGEMFRILEQLEAEGGTNLQRSITEVASTMQKRGLVVVISDLWDEEENLVKAIINLRHLKFEVLVMHVLDPAELSLELRGERLFQDAESDLSLPVNPWDIQDAYKDAMSKRLRDFTARFREHGIDYFLFDTKQPYDVTLARYLRKRF